MSEFSLRVEQLGKRYRIGRAVERANTWHGAVGRMLRSHWNRLRALGEHGAADETIWALRDATFDVMPGEVVGIIGRNGAGKSTLLKILSRVVNPTTGRAAINGRVGSLLEVGTGFHPELTGRENIFLNGAILGMRQAEIRAAFDDIVAFAEIEKFLDTPVKRYSSGMYVRLAFAVAAHLNPEMLLVDEVLAVGDIQFQKKCLGKMGNVARSGRTILFVSHNMAAVEGLCQRGIVLEQGTVIFDGPVRGALGRYLQCTRQNEDLTLAEREDRDGTGLLRFTAVTACDEDGHPVEAFATGRPGLLKLAYETQPGARIENLQVSLGIDSAVGQRIVNFYSEATGDSFEHVPEGRGTIAVRFDRMPLLPGRYHFNVFAALSGVVADWIRHAGYFDVDGGDFYQTGKLPPDGVFCLDGRFEVTEEAPPVAVHHPACAKALPTA